MGRDFLRSLTGGLIGGFILFFTGFVFWGTPLSALAFSRVDAAPGAALQAALAAGLTQTGTGTYYIPNPATDQGTILFGQGPVATVHFNTHGFPVVDSGAILGGLIMALIAGVLIAAGLRIVGGKVFPFRDRAQVAVLFALAITFYVDLGQPVFNHYGWGYFVYSFVADFLGFALAGLAIARWFLPAGPHSS